MQENPLPYGGTPLEENENVWMFKWFYILWAFNDWHVNRSNDASPQKLRMSVKSLQIEKSETERMPFSCVGRAQQAARNKFDATAIHRTPTMRPRNMNQTVVRRAQQAICKWKERVTILLYHFAQYHEPLWLSISWLCVLTSAAISPSRSAYNHHSIDVGMELRPPPRTTYSVSDCRLLWGRKT